MANIRDRFEEGNHLCLLDETKNRFGYIETVFALLINIQTSLKKLNFLLFYNP